MAEINVRQDSQSFLWRYQPMGEAALLLEAEQASPQAHRMLLTLADQLAQLALPGLISSVPAICSLLILFDPMQIEYKALCQIIAGLLAAIGPSEGQKGRTIQIPVRYGGAAGPDLEHVAALCSLRQEEIIALHCAQPYPVLMLGFAPGFPYLGELPAALHVPRRSTPRTAVPAGSVAIAAGMTGIYPARLPGGWHILGATAMPLFDPAKDAPCLLAPGDYVQFYALDAGVIT